MPSEHPIVSAHNKRIEIPDPTIVCDEERPRPDSPHARKNESKIIPHPVVPLVVEVSSATPLPQSIQRSDANALISGLEFAVKSCEYLVLVGLLILYIL